MVTLGLAVYLGGLLSFVSVSKHLLSMLLSLEMMMLGTFVCLVLMMMGGCLELLVFYLVLVVCEASLGLGVMIMSVYYYGSDHISGFSLLSC